MAGIRIVPPLLLLAGAAPAFAQMPTRARPCTSGSACSVTARRGRQGASAELLVPKPRDFTKGLYKIRSTATRRPAIRPLPNHTEGMPGTSMPSWAVLPDRDRHHVVAYLKDVRAEAFKEAPKKLELPKRSRPPRPRSKRGKEMFEAIEFHKCHGTEGRGDGPSRPELKDEWASRSRREPDQSAGTSAVAARAPRSPRAWPTVCSARRCPPFSRRWRSPRHLAPDQLHRLARPDSPQPATLVTVAAVRDAIPDDPGAEFWKKLAPNNILLEGQVIVDPRNFNPSIDLVGVRAVYNDKEIAFHLTWTTPREQGDGKATFPDAISLQFAPQQPTGRSGRTS